MKVNKKYSIYNMECNSYFKVGAAGFEFTKDDNLVTWLNSYSEILNLILKVETDYPDLRGMLCPVKKTVTTRVDLCVEEFLNDTEERENE